MALDSTSPSVMLGVCYSGVSVIKHAAQITLDGINDVTTAAIMPYVIMWTKIYWHYLLMSRQRTSSLLIHIYIARIDVVAKH